MTFIRDIIEESKTQNILLTFIFLWAGRGLQLLNLSGGTPNSST
jgi:hypothetical protein